MSGQGTRGPSEGERREEEAQTWHEEERRMLREIVPEWKLEKMKREQERREDKERNIR